MVVDFRGKLEVFANLCLTAASIAVLVVFAGRLIKGDRPQSPAAASGYALGESLPQSEGLDYTAAEKTLLLFLSSRCEFCTESMPFYVQLSRWRQPGRFQMIVLGRERESVLSEYIGQHGLRVDGVRSVRGGEFKVSGTPTLILTSRTGRVVGYWRGLLRGREGEVEAALRQ